jgi:hypothetical protein
MKKQQRSFKAPPGEVSASLGESLALILRRYSLPFLFNGYNPLVTVAALAVVVAVSFTLATLGALSTVAYAVALAIVHCGLFIRLHGFVKTPKQPRQQAQRLVAGFGRNIVTPVAGFFVQRPLVAFALITVIAELSKWVGDDTITVPLIAAAASAFLVAEKRGKDVAALFIKARTLGARGLLAAMRGKR